MDFPVQGNMDAFLFASCIAEIYGFQDAVFHLAVMRQGIDPAEKGVKGNADGVESAMAFHSNEVKTALSIFFILSEKWKAQLSLPDPNKNEWCAKSIFIQTYAGRAHAQKPSESSKHGSERIIHSLLEIVSRADEMDIRSN